MYIRVHTIFTLVVTRFKPTLNIKTDVQKQLYV